jgi:hypothetical protein
MPYHYQDDRTNFEIETQAALDASREADRQERAEGKEIRKEGEKANALLDPKQRVNAENFNILIDQYGQEAADAALSLYTVDNRYASKFTQGANYQKVNEAAALFKSGTHSLDEINVLLSIPFGEKQRQDETARLQGQQRATQQQRARTQGASQRFGTSATGLLEPAHLARTNLSGGNFFSAGGGR